MQSLLMVAFHYPPLYESSGTHRTLAFSKYLPDHGWHPHVLVPHPRAYAADRKNRPREVPEVVTIHTSFALDAAKHLSIFGKHPRALALPDRWASWCLGAVPVGLRLISRYRPSFIWTTYPIATALRIGWILHRLTKVPWIVDFRDSMTEDGFPINPQVRASYCRIEELAVKNARMCIFTTPGALQMYASRYPDVPNSHWAIIPNGFDEDNFTAAQQTVVADGREPRPFQLLHSGLLYPHERDPKYLFQALSVLKHAGTISSSNLRVAFRAAGNTGYFEKAAREAKIDDIVTFLPSLPYKEALAEMLQADALLLMQAKCCNHQIPAKLYEYLRTGRPILALTDPGGDTAQLLNSLSVGLVIPLDNQAAIERQLPTFLADGRSGTSWTLPPGVLSGFSRKNQTVALATILDSLLRDQISK
jgi:glycosyltransferase involved in cell wall biosynthesis